MKQIALYITLLFLGFGLQAQNSPKAKKLLDEVSKKVRAYDNIQINFKTSLSNSETGVKEAVRGEATIEGEKYILSLFGQERLFDGETLHIISPEDEDIIITKPSGKTENEILPSKMLTFYEKGYTYQWDILQKIKGRQIQYIKLHPINSDAEIKDILLGIDTQTKHIFKLIQTDNKGTKYTTTINRFKTNQHLAKSLFVFDKSKYEGYYIDKRF